MPTSFPTDPAAWPAFLSTTVDASLDDARALLARLKDGTPRSTTEVLGLWNDADIAIATGSAAAHLLSEVHPGRRPAGRRRGARAGRRGPGHGARPGPRAVAGARRDGRRRARARCAPAARARAARLPPRRRRPLGGGPRPPAGARAAVHRAGPGVLPEHPRRRPQRAGAARAAGRAARGLPRGAPGRRGRAGHADHRVPGPAAGPHVRDRPVGAAGAHHGAPAHRVAGERADPRGAAPAACRAGHAPGLPGLADVRRRGQDDRLRPGDRGPGRPAGRAHRARRRPGTSTSCSRGTARTCPTRPR